MAQEFPEYERMRDAGLTAPDVYRRACDDGLDRIAAIRTLRQVFGLDLAGAKDAMLRAEGAGGIEENQAKLLPAVTEALEALTREEFLSDTLSAIRGGASLHDLRRIVCTYRDRGIPQQTAYDALQELRAQAANEAEEDVILEVMDIVAGCISQHMKVWP